MQSADIEKIQKVLGPGVTPTDDGVGFRVVVKSLSKEEILTLEDLGFIMIKIPVSGNTEFTVKFSEGHTLVKGMKADIEKIQKVLGPNVKFSSESGILNAIVTGLSTEDLDALWELGYLVDELPVSGNKNFTVKFEAIESRERIQNADEEKIQNVIGSEVKSIDGGSGLSATVKGLSTEDLDALWELGYVVDAVFASDGGEFAVKVGPYMHVMENWLKADVEKIQNVIGSGAKYSARDGLHATVRSLTQKNIFALWKLGYFVEDVRLSDGGEFAVKFFHRKEKLSQS